MYKLIKIGRLSSFLLVLVLLSAACTVTIEPPRASPSSQIVTEIQSDSMGIEIVPFEPDKVAGMSPAEAIAPTGEWTTLEKGEYQWFAFNFDFDADYKEPVQIQMYTEPRDSAVLRLLNRDQVQLWNSDGELKYFGSATFKEYDADKETAPEFAHWTGDLFSSGKYYILVEHSKDIKDTARYRFTIQGDGVTY